MSDATDPGEAEDVTGGVEAALSDAEREVAALSAEVDAVGRAGRGGAGGDVVVGGGIDMLSDVELDVRIELGRTEMMVEDVLQLGAGSVVELDKLAGDPVDVFVNGRRVARGEVLVLNDNFCIRISEVVDDLEAEAEAAAAG